MATKNKRITMLVISILFVAVIVIMIGRNQERVAQPMINMDKYSYANLLSFEVRMTINGYVFQSWTSVQDSILPGSRFFDPSFNELVFVHNEAESRGFPDNVIVAWPRERTIEGLIASIHWAVNRQDGEIGVRGNPIALRRPVVTLEEFGLTYPLTVEDLVSNWEKVFALFRVFTPFEQSVISDAGSMGWEKPED